MQDKEKTSSDTSTKRVVIFNSSGLLCTGLEHIVNGLENTQCVGTATETASALALCDAESPDLVISDIDPPGLDGILITEEQKNKRPKTKVLIISESAEKDRILAALATGADGYFVNDGSCANAKNAIVTILKGGLWIDASIAPTIRQGAHMLWRLPLKEPSKEHTLSDCIQTEYLC
jgi:DNA-binding NarL/FixJ family response regulator